MTSSEIERWLDPEAPGLSLEARLAFGVHCALAVYHHPGWTRWAEDWLDGRAQAPEDAAAAHVLVLEDYRNHCFTDLPLDMTARTAADLVTSGAFLLATQPDDAALAPTIAAHATQAVWCALKAHPTLDLHEQLRVMLARFHRRG
ncbi:MAG: hypothetical protein HY329_13285 [Chloroflexi bacterium]|nr:hypothetical protein [Chloroflexota bacterium]